LRRDDELQQRIGLRVSELAGIERVQLRVESSAVKRSLYVCCSAVIFEVCSYSETVIVPVLNPLRGNE
jgi:hypothetical protein